MKGFAGFPAKGRLIKIPELFFGDLLPDIDHLAELKVTLYCFWRLQQKDSKIIHIWEQELASDEGLVSGLGGIEALHEGLDRATARGMLLRVEANRGGKAERLYFINTERGRAMAGGVASGKWQPDDDPNLLVDLRLSRPNIFTLYEQNIGPLTPLIAEHLNEFETTYPGGWIEEAIAIAVTHNKRHLKYIEAILKRWQSEGRGGEDQLGGGRFLSGKYRDEIEH